MRSSGVRNAPISDTLPLNAVLKLKPIKAALYTVSARSYKNYLPNLFTAGLTNKYSRQLLSIFVGNDVNTKLNIFNKVLQSTHDLHASIITREVPHRPCPFVSSDIKELMKTRDRLNHRFRLSPDPVVLTNYKKSRNVVKRSLRDAERKYTFKEVEENKHNPSSLWKVINRLIPSKAQ